MSLYRIDGWDFFVPNATGSTVVGPNFTADGFTGGLSNWNTSPGRFGGNCIYLANNSQSFHAINRRFTTETVIIGHAFRMDAPDIPAGCQFGVYDGEGASYYQCGVSFDQNGVIRANRGNAGDLTQFGVVGAANNWDAVNEFVLTDAEYTWTQTVGNEDLYAMDPIITAANIFGMQITGAWRQDDATQMKGHSLIKTHGTIYEGADNELAQSYRYYRDVYELNPNTGVGWTAAELNAVQGGQKLLVG
jgi:hypothetical protein